MTFPLEIYTEIISHITHKPTLFTLLLTSRFLNREVEKKLYREPDPAFHVKHNLLVHLATCSRVARHVRSYKMPVFSDWVKEVLPALHLLNNLKALTLWEPLDLPEKPKLSSLISSASFQLRKFITNFPVDCHLQSFLRFQSQIMHLELHDIGTSHLSEPGLVLSRVDLPALSAFHYSTPIPPIYSLFPEFFITNLSFHGFISIPLPAVRALRTIRPQTYPPLSLLGTPPPSMMETLPFVFPNLRFLDIEYDVLHHLNLQDLSCLQKLTMSTYSQLPNAADIVLRIYTRHKTLKSVEIHLPEYHTGCDIVYRVQERHNPQTMASEPVCETYSYFNDHLEWATW